MLSKLDHSCRNRLLKAASENDFNAISAQLTKVDANLGEHLIRGGEPEEWAYFPEEAVVSIVRTMQDGSVIEVGIIGCDGVVGIHSIGKKAH